MACTYADFKLRVLGTSALSKRLTAASASLVSVFAIRGGIEDAVVCLWAALLLLLPSMATGRKSALAISLLCNLGRSLVMLALALGIMTCPAGRSRGMTVNEEHSFLCSAG